MLSIQIFNAYVTLVCLLIVSIVKMTFLGSSMLWQRWGRETYLLKQGAVIGISKSFGTKFRGHILLGSLDNRQYVVGLGVSCLLRRRGFNLCETKLESTKIKGPLISAVKILNATIHGKLKGIQFWFERIKSLFIWFRFCGFEVRFLVFKT